MVFDIERSEKSLWLNRVGLSGITTGTSALLQKSSCTQGHGTSEPPGSGTQPASQEELRKRGN